MLEYIEQNPGFSLFFLGAVILTVFNIVKKTKSKSGQSNADSGHYGGGGGDSGGGDSGGGDGGGE